jgi:lipopolysaccharide biosynthesis glycosyltransferase
LQRPLHIATAIDESYLLPLAITLASLTENLGPEYRPVLHLLNRNLDPAQLAKISALVETHSIVPSDDSIASIPRQSGFVPEVSFPLLLGELLPESVERVLFLDPDLLVVDDVAKIWEAELGDKVIAAAVDQAIPMCSSPRGVNGRRSLRIPEAAPYFNAGVMLIDIRRWRLRDVSARACAYLEDRRERIDHFHQEALNAVLWQDWLRLDQRWNLIASLAGRQHGPYKSTRCERPGIIHFAGHFKPWRFKVGGPFADAYDKFLTRFSAENGLRKTGLSERLLSIYDRHAREYLYPFEQALWNSRLV